MSHERLLSDCFYEQLLLQATRLTTEVTAEVTTQPGSQVSDN